jgi:hypothetical protein
MPTRGTSPNSSERKNSGKIALRNGAGLTRLYREEQQDRAKDGLAVAIAAAADDDLVDDVIALARDTRQGPSRLLLLSALERSASPQARAALMDLGTDVELEKEIRVILRRLKRAK